MIFPTRHQRAPRLTFDRLTDPIAEPLTLAQAKAHCRVDIPDDDALFLTWISLAREYCEDQTHRQFITATYALQMDGFPHAWHGTMVHPVERGEGTDIILPRPNLQSVESITYVDEDGATQTVDPSLYIVSTLDKPGCIALAPDQVWPCARRQMNAVRIDYTAGYGDDGNSVPQAIKQAMLLLISHWNEQREAALTGARAASVEIDFSVSALLRPHVCDYQWEGGGQ